MATIPLDYLTQTIIQLISLVITISLLLMVIPAIRGVTTTLIQTQQF